MGPKTVTMQSDFRTVNLADPRQDVHIERRHNPNLYRYTAAERLLPTQPSGLSVLELGGGIGEFSRRLRARNIDVTFADLSEHNVAKARSFGCAAHRVDLNEGLAVFPDASFDGIVMLEIIEHVVAAEFLLQECARVLKPNGFLILSTPNFAYLFNRLRILFGKLSSDEGYHYRFFTRSSLKRQLREAHFNIDRYASSVPAMGVNFIWNRMLHRDRKHVQVPRFLSSLFAQTLMVRARKA